MGRWVAEWGTGPGHWPLPAWVSSPSFLPWVGADIHAFWLQGNLFSVTNGAEELSDRRLVAWTWRAALPLAWGPRLSAGQYLRLEREPGASGKQPGNQGPGCRTWVHPALLRETGQLCTNARWPEPASIPCLLHPSLPASPTAATQAGDNCRAHGGEVVSFCLEVKPGTCLCGVHEAADCAQMQRPGLGLGVGADEERQRDHLRLVVSGPHLTLGLSCRVSRKGGVGASLLNVTHVSSCLLDCPLS